jgi:hypothetical protein
MSTDRGTAVIEVALAMIILLMLALGAYEWGTGFADRNSMASAAREGGRVGSAAGDNPDADCRVIEASAGALNAVSGNTVKSLWIYESDANGAIGNRQEYRPFQSGDDAVDLRCSNNWFLAANGWPSSSRVTTGSARDWLGVKVIVEHAWKTGFLWWNGTVDWQEDAVFHIEPGVVD